MSRLDAFQRAATRSVAGVALGAGAVGLGVIIATAYSMALGVAVLQELLRLPSWGRPR